MCTLTVIVILEANRYTGYIELRSVTPSAATPEASMYTGARWESEFSHPTHSLLLAYLVHLTHPSRPGPIPPLAGCPLPLLHCRLCLPIEEHPNLTPLALLHIPACTSSLEGLGHVRARPCSSPFLWVLSVLRKGAVISCLSSHLSWTQSRARRMPP